MKSKRVSRQFNADYIRYEVIENVRLEQVVSGQFSPLSTLFPSSKPPRSAPAPSFSATPAPRSTPLHPIFGPLLMGVFCLVI